MAREVRVHCTPLYGARDYGAVGSLLEVDDVRILLDCGWDERFDVRSIDRLRDVAPHVDVVLISHPDMEHVGALPYARAHWGLDAPVYMTAPTQRLGQVVLYEAVLAQDAESVFDLVTLEMVDLAFRLNDDEAGDGRVVTLRFQEDVRLPGASGLAITPDRAGRTLGGAVWRISQLSEQIVYAPAISARSEAMLDRSVLITSEAWEASDSPFVRATLFVSDAGRPHLVGFRPPPLPALRDGRDPVVQKLLHLALARRGDVLVPLETSGRALELLLRCESQWDPEVQLIWFHPLGELALQFAQMHLESMSNALNESFGTERRNPFEMQFAQVVGSQEQLRMARLTSSAAPQTGQFVHHNFGAPLVRKPLVLLTSFPSLDIGAGRQMLSKWAAEPANSVAFVSVPRAGSLAAQMLAQPPPPALTLRLRRRRPLEGEELQEWKRQNALQRAAEARGQEFRAVGGAGTEDAEDATAEEANASGEATYGGNSSTASAAPYSDTDTRQRPPPSHSADPAPGDEAAKQPESRVARLRRKLKSRAAMFSYEERVTQPTEYGDPVDVAWIRDPTDVDELPLASLEAEGEGTLSAGLFSTAQRAMTHHRRLAAASSQEEEGAADAAEVPMTTEEVEEHVPLRCRVEWVEMDGRVDHMALAHLVESLMPEKVVFAFGTESRLRWLCRSLRKSVPRLLVPASGERAEGSSGTALLKLQLSNALFQRLDFHRVGRYDVARVEAEVGAEGDSADGPSSAAAAALSLAGGPGRVLRPPAGEADAEAVRLWGRRIVAKAVEDSDTKGAEEALPHDAASRSLLRKAPLKLRWVRGKLEKAGLRTRIQAGALVSNSGVVIRRSNEQKESGSEHLVVEGPYSDEFFLARDIVYGLNVVV